MLCPILWQHFYGIHQQQRVMKNEDDDYNDDGDDDDDDKYLRTDLNTV